MKEKKKTSTLWKVYLYIFSALGIVLLVIGGVGLVNLALKSWVFTEADKDYYVAQPPMPVAYSKAELISNSSDFTEEEQAQARMWLQDYNSWKENSGRNDYRTSQNQRTAAQSLALIIIGLPLYLYHWFILRREH